MSSLLRVISRNSLFALALATVGIPPAASDEGDAAPSPNFIRDRLGLTGSARMAYWHADKSYSADRHYAPTSLWLTLRPEEVAGTKLFVEAYAQTNDLTETSRSLSDSLEAELREAYLFRSFGDFDVKIGRQVLVWGRGDKVNPTDVLTTKDLTLLMTDDEEQRLGIFTTQLTYNWGETRVTGVWQPEWRSPVYPIPPIPGVNLVTLDPQKPETQFATRVDQTGGAFDWSLSFANVYTRVPDFQVLGVQPSGAVDLGLIHRRVRVFGGDIAWNWGDYGWRAEAAYTRSSDSSGRDPLTQNSGFFGVLGVDRSVIENLNLNAQVLYKYVFDFVDPSSYNDPATRTLAAQEALVANQVSRHLYGLTFRPSWKMLNETLEAEVAYVTWLNGGLSRDSSLLRPKLTYAFTDHWKGIVGGETYFGSASTFFGRLSGTSSVFAEGRFSF